METSKTGIWDLSLNILILKSVTFQLKYGKMDLSK